VRLRFWLLTATEPEESAGDGVRSSSVWKKLFGLQRAVVEDVWLEDEQLVVAVRPAAGERDRCPRCRRRCPGYDLGEGRRRWRALDAGTMRVCLEAHAPRIRCKRHGVLVAAVPWARRGSGFTREFEDQAAWLAVNTSKSAVAELMRIAWRTVGAIITRVWAEIEASGDRLEGLRRIGIDEISYKRGLRYLTVIVDHDSRRLVWVAEGRDKDTLRRFFDQLGPDRAALITHVSADQADWITAVVSERCPRAVQCADPFHVIQWAIEALDQVRRESWKQARQAGQTVEGVRASVCVAWAGWLVG
jgi:transposase